jgi:hypothetical protein
MGENMLAFLDDERRHRERLAQVHLRRIGLRGEAFALLRENLATEPLHLMREGGELRDARRGALSEGR